MHNMQICIFVVKVRDTPLSGRVHWPYACVHKVRDRADWRDRSRATHHPRGWTQAELSQKAGVSHRPAFEGTKRRDVESISQHSDASRGGSTVPLAELIGRPTKPTPLVKSGGWAIPSSRLPLTLARTGPGNRPVNSSRLTSTARGATSRPRGCWRLQESCTRRGQPDDFDRWIAP